MTDVGKTTEARLATLEADIRYLRDDIRELTENHIFHIQKDLESIRKKLHGRPTWAVTTIVSVLTAIVAGLLSLVLR